LCLATLCTLIHNRSKSTVIEINLVNFFTIGIIAMIFFALVHFVGAKFNIPMLQSA
jgi:hypothetical protein